MKFWEAMKALQEGKIVRKKGDCYPNYPQCMERAYEEGMKADWEIYEKTVDFFTVLKGLQIGKKFTRIENRSYFSVTIHERGFVCWNDCKEHPVTVQDIQADDWVEIFDEK